MNQTEEEPKYSEELAEMLQFYGLRLKYDDALLAGSTAGGPGVPTWLPPDAASKGTEAFFADLPSGAGMGWVAVGTGKP